MKQILRRDWLPARSRWSYLARSGLPVTRAPSFTVNPHINPLLAKQVRSMCRYIGFVLFYLSRNPKMTPSLCRLGIILGEIKKRKKDLKLIRDISINCYAPEVDDVLTWCVYN